MKNFLLNLLNKIIVLVFLAGITAWVVISMPIIVAAVFVQLLLTNYDFDNCEVIRNEFGQKLVKLATDFLVLPFRWLGVCDDFKSYLSWMSFNS